ncbi:uncharacterized protein LOC130293185 isoform X3 [Hyla sarda]|uniref:uncharacterized protein LOC130293185 isoform X3 n=1 Tax=Hyla sarda TaxID=327740 RepID=UPI0024C3671D|nr:uncharacterized protein LOC130293185 isoform X3 [Hyla sarda]
MRCPWVRRWTTKDKVGDLTETRCLQVPLLLRPEHSYRVSAPAGGRGGQRLRVMYIRTCFTMRVLLLVCVQTILMASGNCLQCITCANHSKMTPAACHGPSLLCGVNQVCLTFNMSTYLNQGSVYSRSEVYYITKYCWDYKHCEQSGKISFPSGGRTFSTSCCSTDNCTSLPAVNRLRCTTCFTTAPTEVPDCHGPSLQCGEEQVCLTLHMSIFSIEDSIFSRNMMYFVGRQCWNKKDCNIAGKVTSASLKIILGTDCCFSDDCWMHIAPLPLEINTHNGLVCPAHGTFKENNLAYAIKCTEYEEFCFLYATAKKPQVYTIGCASISYCQLLHLINKYYHYIPNSQYAYTTCSRAHLTSSLPVVNSLLCWHCRGSVDLKCEVFAKCSAENDACVTIFTKTSYGIGGKTEMQLFKRCGFSSECNKAGIITTAQKSISKNTTCCYSDHCISPIPTLPSESNKTNGLICESCYLEDSGSCSGISRSSEIFSGCAHPSICDSGNINITYHQTTFEETKTCSVPAKSSEHSPNILYASVMFVIWSNSIYKLVTDRTNREQMMLESVMQPQCPLGSLPDVLLWSTWKGSDIRTCFTMRLLLLACVQTILMASGSCLQCEMCRSYGESDNCYSEMKNCVSDHVCFLLRFETHELEQEFTTWEVNRQCWNPLACFTSGQVSSSKYKIRFVTSCCFEDNCKIPLPDFPAENTAHNGLFCPTCISNTSKCVPNNSMKCVGEETWCFTLNAASKPTLTFSGCATPSYCRVHPLIGDKFRNNDDHIRPVKLSCVIANRTSSLPVVNLLFCKKTYGINSEKLMRCSPINDACLTILVQTTHECNSAGTITTGKKNISKNTTCCFHDNCISPIPTLPSQSNETNGIFCESCYYKTYGICMGQDYIACTGNATRCISYATEQKSDVFTSSEVFHGCAHPELCESGNITGVDGYLTLKETVLCGIASKMSVHRPNLLCIFYALYIVYSFRLF